jgi:hypothetical protein
MPVLGMSAVPPARRWRRTRWGGAVAAVALLLPLTGCAKENPRASPPLGAVERTDSMSAIDLVLVTNGHGVARLVGTLANTGTKADRLVGADLDGEVGHFSLIFGDGPFVIPPDQPLKLARDAEVTVISDQLRPGFDAKLTLYFADSRPVQSHVIVRRQRGAYKDVEVIRPPDGDIAPS